MIKENEHRETITATIRAKKAYPKLDPKDPDEPEFWDIVFEDKQAMMLSDALKDGAAKADELTIRITRKLGEKTNRHAVSVTYEVRMKKTSL